MANFLRQLIDAIRSNFYLILKGVISAILLFLGPLLAIVVRLGNANMGIIISVGLISEAMGLGAFWLVIRKEYHEGEEEAESEESQESEETSLTKIRSKIFGSKTKNEQD